jgi:hypothetical protein
VGVGFFFLSKIIGGGREVANATDAGVLNVAKQAVRRGAVPLTGGLISEFGALTEPVNTKVDLVTYNRLVAQALIVGKNAEVLGGPAIGHANQLRADVRTIGLALKNNLASEPNFASDFSSIASENNTKMWNGPAVSLVGTVSSGYMKTGSSTNVYFAPATLAALGGWAPPLSSQPAKANPAARYLAGYTPFNVNGNATFLYGVPVLPQTKPHLVDHGQFNTTAIDPDTPPNAFRTNSRALEAKSGAMGTSVACAIVGVINKEFAAVIPRGFIRVLNGQDAFVNGNPAVSMPVSNGANDIFNNELFHGDGVLQANTGANNGGQPVFSHYASRLSQAKADWSAYYATRNTVHNGDSYTDTHGDLQINNITDNGPPGSAGNYYAGNPNLWAVCQDYLTNPAAHDIRTGGAHNQYATFADLWALAQSNDTTQCKFDMYDTSLAGKPEGPACINNLSNWSTNFGRNDPGTSTYTPPPGGFTNVEYMKADLLGKIAGKAGGGFCASVGGMPNPSGLKAWPGDVKSGANGSNKPYTGGSTKVNYLETGTPLTYLRQLGIQGGSSGTTCPYNQIIDSVWKRMQQVQPTLTKSDVETALNSTTLSLGGSGTADNGKLYLYVQGNNCMMTNSLPGYTDSAIPADGPTPSGADVCNSSYPVNGWAVNTAKSMPGSTVSTGDGGYHEMPFTQPNPGSGPRGTDRAIFHPASGFNNLLGELKFEQEVQGATFCKPN